MPKKRLGNIKKINLPICGEELEIDGHHFLIQDVKNKIENGHHIASFVAESPLIKVTITLSSSLPLFKSDE